MQDALEGVVPLEHMEEAASVPGIDLATGSINMVLDIIDLGHEFEAAQLARSSGNYAAGIGERRKRAKIMRAQRWT